MTKRKKIIAKDAPQPEPRQPDPIGERLIADGYAPNEFILDLGGGISAKNLDTYPWNLPSRLFTFPVETLRGPDGIRRIALQHPLLSEHPLAQELVAKGYELSSPGECVNDCGVSVADIDKGSWWHAVDLIEHHPQELLNTRQFTTDEDLAAAVCFRCQYPHTKGPLTTLLREMRAIMKALDVPEPPVSVSTFRSSFSEPHPCVNEDKVTRWPINTGHALKCAESAETAWTFIHAIEQGWFENRGGYLQWAARGRAVHSGSEPAPVFTPAMPTSAPVQGRQLSLF